MVQQGNGINSEEEMVGRGYCMTNEEGMVRLRKKK